MPVTDHVARYRDIARLGAGGMATVTLAEDTVLGRRVALKRVHAGGERRALPRLRREALVGASLNHPNLVAIFDVEVGEDGDLVIVMEYVEGQTLRDALDGPGALPPAFALEVLTGVAAALDTIHARGIVHRDVKPANILLGRDGAVKLADLGIATAADRTRITTAGVILGTFSYMAPEQLEGKPATPAVDVYALAAVAFEMLSGRKARPQSNPVALAHAIATQPVPDLGSSSGDAHPLAAAVLKRGMHSDPDQRPRSAGELVDRLRAALEPPDGTAPVVGPRERRPEPPRDTAPIPVRPVPAPAPAPVADIAAASRPAAPRPPVPTPSIAAPPRRPEAGAAAPRSRRPAARAPAPRSAPAPAATAAWRDRVGAVRAFGAVRASGAVRAFRGRSAWILAAIVGLGAAFVALGLVLSGGGGSAPPAGSSRTHRHATSAGSAAGGAAGGRATAQPASSGGGKTSPSGGVATSPSGGVTTSPTPSTPSGAVQAFYLHAASHDYTAAWALADGAFRSQLQGYQSFAAQQSAVRSLTFHRAETVSQGQNTATVAVETTSVTSAATQRCSGSVRLVRAQSGIWMLDQISINCI